MYRSAGANQGMNNFGSDLVFGQVRIFANGSRLVEINYRPSRVIGGNGLALNELPNTICVISFSLVPSPFFSKDDSSDAGKERMKGWGTKVMEQM